MTATIFFPLYSRRNTHICRVSRKICNALYVGNVAWHNEREGEKKSGTEKIHLQQLYLVPSHSAGEETFRVLCSQGSSVGTGTGVRFLAVASAQTARSPRPAMANWRPAAYSGPRQV
jgi:hypothetical protein